MSKLYSLTLLLLVSVCAGCGESASNARFIPEPKLATSALTAALTAWKGGAPPGPVAGTQHPAVHITDSYRKTGEKLADFEILGEVPGDVPRCYAVQLRFTNSERQEKVRYVIVGIDPLWVFRMEDYQLLGHWEHKMDEAATQENSNARQLPSKNSPVSGVTAGQGGGP